MPMEDLKHMDADYDPFIELARHYPYSKSVDLCETDKARLINAMIELVEAKVQMKETYCMQAAIWMQYLKLDYGLPYAAAFWTSLRNIKAIHLNESFFKYRGVQGILRDIYAAENMPETLPAEKTVTSSDEVIDIDDDTAEEVELMLTESGEYLN